MNSVGIQALLLQLIGIHSAVAHHEVMGLFEIARVLGNSYRLATSEPGSGTLYGRFTFDFCRTIVAGAAR
ncbi:hypothetical protein JQ607_36485 [Bradyrhizobium liaoningense]|uniref:hypothetical protein n=1 Tax=Bradyrhizobium liaoningense TaxID=43992 RepID=UPI001BAB60C1|nr:hypothetical protein [Bradyrhizobium liaoningense]MBR0845719.1 hypothetical protein [Bradyrhizobium liaoningense]